MINKKTINKLLSFKHIVRPKSLIITVMSDTVSVHGGQIWAGSLVEVCNWFNISDHSSRISLQRLVDEGWLVGKKHKFYIYYEFSKNAMSAYELNKPTVYQKIGDDWKGGWQVLIIRKDSSESRQFIKDIIWRGYCKLYKNIYLFPIDKRKYMEQLVKEYKLKEQVVFMNGSMTDLNDFKTIDAMVEKIWHIDSAINVYKSFLDKISSLTPNVLAEICQSPENSLYTRLKLIHEYRRLVIKYNKLPLKLYKQEDLWEAIYKKVGKLYHQTNKSAMVYINQYLKYSKGFLVKADKNFYKRFSQSSSRTLKNPSEQFFRLSSKKLRSFLK